MSDEPAKKKIKPDTSPDPRENPYLAHLSLPQRLVGADVSADPLAGFIPGRTTAAQAFKAEESALNPFNGKPFSARYYKILEGRRKLPVHRQRDEFLEMLHNNQILVLVGETGSGKTTQ